MINNSCFIITSYVDTFEKEKISLKLLDYLKDKNLPIIFVGNYKIPESIQEKADWVLYTKENPKINRDMVIWSQIPYNPKFKTTSHTQDHGYAHLLQAYRGFKLAESLSYDHAIHLNYDMDLDDNSFKIITEALSINSNVVSGHGENGYCTNVYSFKIKDFISVMDASLHYYENVNPPGIMPGWICETFFKWALTKSNIDIYQIPKFYWLKELSTISFLYINNFKFKIYPWEENNTMLLCFDDNIDINKLVFLVKGKEIQALPTPISKDFTLPFKKGKYYDQKGNFIFNIDDEHISRFKIKPIK